MNKAVIALVLLGLVVLATAVEAGYASKDKLEKMRMKKGKAMAKKERTNIEKLKDIKMREGIKRMEGMGGETAADAKSRGKDAIARAYAALKQQLVDRQITPEQFKEQARLIKEQAKREMVSGQTRQEEARKDKGRNKRAAKEMKEAMKKRRSALKSKTASKFRRGQ